MRWKAIEAGITDLIFIIGRNKRAIPDHFDMAYELENELERNGKKELLKIVQNIIPKHVNCIYIRQAQALGLGHAVRIAKPVVNDEPFAVLLADDLLDGNVPVMKQMIEAYDYYRCSLLGVQNVPREQTKSYGIVATTPVNEKIEQVSGIVEKPKPEDAPSTLGVVGRYILTPRIFHHLDRLQPGADPAETPPLKRLIVHHRNAEPLASSRLFGECGESFRIELLSRALDVE